MRADSEFVGGHGVLAVERFLDNTRHMIIFEDLSEGISDRPPCCLQRRFLSDSAYADALEAEKNGSIKILKYAAVIEGHILDVKKKRRQ